MSFIELLIEAKQENEPALEELYRMYRPLIAKMSRINDVFDEDLFSEQTICFLGCVKLFSIERVLFVTDFNQNT